MKYLSRSIKDSMLIVATPTTHEFLNILGYQVPEHKAISVDYHRRFEFNGETIELYPARHIAGSAQVLVETKEGSAGYTGDFKMPGTEPMKGLDVLVIDATYGSPHLTRKGTEWDALSALIDLIESKGLEGPVWLYGFNGKLQEIMVELRIRGVRNPFMADQVTLKLAQVASKFYGVELGKVNIFDSTRAGPGTIVFMHVKKSFSATRAPGVHVVLTGRERRGTLVEVKPNLYNLAYSDHASFPEIIEYVEEARPRKVVVDGTRGFDPGFTAKYLNKVLKVDATVEPEVQQVERTGET